MKTIIADNKPTVVTLNKGEEYFLCACGKSGDQPLCDGSHVGSSFKPMSFTAEEDGEVYLCECKHSGNFPHCDGTQKQLRLNIGSPRDPRRDISHIFKDLSTVADFKRFADRVREISGGTPIGFKLSANRIERDIQFALDASADDIILDGRGGGTGAAPEIFRDHISVPNHSGTGKSRSLS
ncbi:MAG: CDGSH-type Zn-finger protein [bacterium]|jgi:CDGSH-type Zn-finger protein